MLMSLTLHRQNCGQREVLGVDVVDFKPLKQLTRRGTRCRYGRLYTVKNSEQREVLGADVVDFTPSKQRTKRGTRC